MLSGKGKILLCCLMLLLVTGCSGKNTDESEKSEKFQSDYMELNASGTKVEEGIFSLNQAYHITLILIQRRQFKSVINRIVGIFLSMRTKIPIVMRQKGASKYSPIKESSVEWSITKMEQNSLFQNLMAVIGRLKGIS